VTLATMLAVLALCGSTRQEPVPEPAETPAPTPAPVQDPEPVPEPEQVTPPVGEVPPADDDPAGSTGSSGTEEPAQDEQPPSDVPATEQVPPPVEVSVDAPAAPPAETPAETPEATTTEGVEPAPVLPAMSPRFDFIRGASFEAVADELTRLAGVESERLSVVSYGTSHAGRELYVATIGEAVSTDRPALFLVADLDTPGARGPAPPSAGLFVVAEILARAKGEERVRRLLRKAAVHIVLTPDPDALVSVGFGAPARDVPRDAAGDVQPAPASAGDVVLDDSFRRADLNRNFPIGWTPFVEPPSAALPGPYPLCEPESLALARYLLERTALRGTVLWTRRQGAPDGDGSFPASGYAEDTLQRLGLGQAEIDSFRARSVLVEEPGSLARFCRSSLEGPVLFAPAWEGPELETVLGPAPAGFVRLVDLVVAMLEELPRIEVGEPQVERLRANLWQVEVSLWRGGALAEARPMSHPAGPTGGVRLTCAGADVQMVAVRRGADGPFVPLPRVSGERAEASPGPTSLGPVTVDGTLELRLVVAGDEGSELELVLDSAATGPATLKVSLR